MHFEDLYYFYTIVLNLTVAQYFIIFSTKLETKQQPLSCPTQKDFDSIGQP